jgi:hypothetical protein
MKHALTFGAILAVFAFLARRQVPPGPFYYDEADYMFAASLGAKANWIDSPSQSLLDFLRVGLRDGRDPSKRTQLSAAARKGSDVNFYRHWHGPLYFCWLSAIARWKPEEHRTRALSYMFPMFTAVVIYFGSLWISASSSAAILSAAFFLWGYATVLTNEIAPHHLYALCFIVSLTLLMKWRATGHPLLWYGSIAAAACAFCTLEVAFVLVFLLAIYTVRARSILKSGLAFLLTIAVIWPAALVKLTFVKAYLFMAYLAVFRPSAWGNTGIIETWRHRFTQSPVEWLLLAVAAVLYFLSATGATRKQVAPVVLFGALALLALLRVNSESPRYMLPFLPAFQYAAGFTFSDAIRNWKAPLRVAAVLALLGALFSGTLSAVRAHPVQPSPRLNEVLAAVRDANLDGKTLLAPQNDVPMIHYYFPRIHSLGYANNLELQTILAQIACDAILDPGYPVTLKRRSQDSAHYVSH